MLIIKNYPILKKIVPIVFLFFAIFRLKHSALKLQLLFLLVFVLFSFRGNAQCTITGTTVNSSAFNPNPCATAILSGCSIVYVGDGVNPTTLTINNDLDLTCLGPIQLIVRNLATIFFQSSNRLILAASSNLIIETGGDLAEGSPCSASQRIYIGSDLISSCNGGGGTGVFTFGDLVANGGTLNAEITTPSNNPSISCMNQVINLQGGYKGAGTGVTYTWIVSDPDNLFVGGIITTGSLANNSAYTTPTSFTLTKTGDYIISLSVTGGSFTNIETKTIKVSPFNTWNGSVSTDWNTAGNWCTGVPNATNTLDVLIPSGLLTNYPTISADDSAGEVVNIVFESGSILNIVDNYLKVTGNLTLNGKIDLEGESQLLQDTGSTLDAASTGSIEIDQQGTGDSFNYNYWSSPVNSNLAAKTYSIGGVLKDGTDATAIKNITFGAAHTWAEGDVGSIPIRLSTYWMYKLENSRGYAAWTRIGKDITIKAGEGYTMKGSNTTAAEQNYTFVGKPNNGDISLPIAIDNDYLVGNPYPSAIDADQFIDNNPDTTGPLYFWEHYGGGTHNLAGYQGGYATYTKAGGVSASMGPAVASISTSGTSSKGKPGRYVPVGQAFFVVGGAANGYINFKNSQRIFVKESQRDANNDSYSVFMKTSNTKVKDSDTDLSDLRPKFRIGFDVPKISHRQLLLTIDEKATPAVDRGYEAEVYEIFVDDFYWMLDGKKYIIQATNNVGLNSEVPIGIQLSKTGMVTVKIDALENVDDDTSIYLKDKLTGESFNIREKPVQLNLTAGKYAERFVLVFKTQKLVAEDVKAEILIPATSQPIIEGIHVYMNNAIGELQIKNNSTEEIVSVALINSLGQTVKTWNSNFNIRTISLPISTATGIYLVQINTKTGKTVKKISVE